MSTLERPSAAHGVAARLSPEVGVLTALLVLLFGIPSRLAFPPLGAAGSPTQMAGMALAFLWALQVLGGRRARPTTLHWTLLALIVVVLASYVRASSHPAIALETSAADRGLLSLLGWSGLFLAVADGLRTRHDLEVFLRRMVVGGGLLALLGLVQFVTKQQLTNYIQIPGLVSSSDLILSDRNGFARPSGTALHAIEFGAVLTMILPFALHFAMYERERTAVRRWWPTAAIALAVPISISRSAILSATVILLVLVPTWPKAVRRRTYVALVGLGSVMYVLVPGLLGTITGLFSGVGSDDSTASRTDSFSLAGDFIGRSPFLGRGFRTLLPSFRIFDNEYLSLLVEVGLLGFAAVLIFFGTAIVGARRRRRASDDPAQRSLAQAFAASIASAACSMALFDMFAFPMGVSLLFLVLGGAAAFLRLTPRTAERSPEPREV